MEARPWDHGRAPQLCCLIFSHIPSPISVSLAHAISLSTAAMISAPMAGKPPNGLSFTQHSSCYLHKHRITFLRTNFRMQGHISMGLVSTLTLGCTRHRRCSESALTCQHPLSPDGQAEVKRGRGCCSDLNNGPQRYPGSNLWNL